MKDANSRKRRRRRSCYDRLRMHMIVRCRARRSNPARSAALQLLALFSVVFRGVSSPTLPPPRYMPPPMSPRHARRLDLARRLDVAPRYVDVVLSQGTVPYAQLFEDIRRGGVSSRDALSELRKRVPEASLDWLDYIQKWNRWSELILCYVPKEQEELTEIRVLKATLFWMESTKPEPKASPTDSGTVTRTGMFMAPDDVDPNKPDGPSRRNP